MKRGSDARGEIFSPWMRRAVLALVVVSAAGGVGSLLYGARFVSPTPIDTDSYGAGPLGHRVFAEVLEELGRHVLQNRGDRYDTIDTPLLVLEPRAEARVDGTLHRLEHVLAARQAQGQPTLVVLPKWELQLGLSMVEPVVEPVGDERFMDVFDAALPDHHGDGRPRVHHVASGMTDTMLVGLLGEFRAEVPELQTIQRLPVGCDVLLDGPTGAVIVEFPRGTYVVSDPDLLHSYNLHRGDHAAMWLALLERIGGDTVVIDETFHGHGHALKLGEALGQFPAILVVAHLAVLLFLIIMLGSRRFGRPEDDPSLGHGPREAIAVAASVLADGQPLGTLAYNYVVEVIQDLHRRLGLPEASTLELRAQHVDMTARRREIAPEAARLLAAAHALPRTKRVTRKTQADAWRLARAAFAFRSKLLEPASKKSSAGAPAPASPSPGPGPDADPQAAPRGNAA